MAKVNVNDKEYIVERNGQFAIINGKKIATDIHKVNDNTYHLIYNGKSITANITNYQSDKKIVTIELDGKEFEVKVVSPLEETMLQMAIQNESQQQHNDLKSPMPGLIQKIMCKEGQNIKRGDQLLVLNAMKMENVIKAAEDATVQKIIVKEGEQVEKGKVLVQF